MNFWRGSKSGFTRAYFGLFFDLLSPLATQKIKTLKKWKNALKILSCYTSVLKIMIIYYNIPEIWLVTDVRFFSFWAIFVPFSPLIAKQIKTIKNKENTWRYQDFTQVYHKSNHMIDDSFDMKRNRQKFFVILGHFLPFYPNKNPKNQSFEKMKKNYWRYHHFTQVYKKLSSNAI